MGIDNGTVLNKDNPGIERKYLPVAASTTLAIGPVYWDGANGLKNCTTTAPAAGNAVVIYWNDTVQDNSAGALGGKYANVYGNGAIVVGTAQGAITVDAIVQVSVTTNAQRLEALAVTTVTHVLTAFAKYLGHVTEYKSQTNTSKPTDAVSGDTNCVFLIKRGVG